MATAIIDHSVRNMIGWEKSNAKHKIICVRESPIELGRAGIICRRADNVSVYGAHPHARDNKERVDGL